MGGRQFHVRTTEDPQLAQETVYPTQIRLTFAHGETVALDGGLIGAPYAEQVRAGEITQIQIELE